MLHAHPRPDSNEYGETDAAWASCFVKTTDLVEAEMRARAFLADAGWDTELLEESKLVSREDLAGNVDALEKFDQALIDGVVVTLHSWDVGAPDE